MKKIKKILLGLIGAVAIGVSGLSMNVEAAGRSAVIQNIPTVQVSGSTTPDIYNRGSSDSGSGIKYEQPAPLTGADSLSGSKMRENISRSGQNAGNAVPGIRDSAESAAMNGFTDFEDAQALGSPNFGSTSSTLMSAGDPISGIMDRGDVLVDSWGARIINLLVKFASWSAVGGIVVGLIMLIFSRRKMRGVSSIAMGLLTLMLLGSLGSVNIFNNGFVDTVRWLLLG